MRNLKKFLALVLAMMMVFSLMITVNASHVKPGTKYGDDAKITSKYDEAIQVLSGLGIYKGYDGTTSTFMPGEPITRAEVTALVYRILSGDVNDKQITAYEGYATANFTDVASGYGWARGYIGYVSNGLYVVGDGNGHFYPGENITGYEALAIILRAIGYDQWDEFKGAGWEQRVATTAQQLGILAKLDKTDGDLKSPATREAVAQMLFSAIAQCSTVNFDLVKIYDKTNTTLAWNNFGLYGGSAATGNAYYGTPTGNISDEAKYNRMIYRVLADVDGKFDAPVAYWHRDTDKNGTEETALAIPVTWDPVYQIAEGQTQAEIIAGAGLTNNTAVYNYSVDGVKNAGITTLSTAANTSDLADTGRGTEVAVYNVDGRVFITVAKTYVALVGNEYDGNGKLDEIKLTKNDASPSDISISYTDVKPTGLDKGTVVIFHQFTAHTGNAEGLTDSTLYIDRNSVQAAEYDNVTVGKTYDKGEASYADKAAMAAAVANSSFIGNGREYFYNALYPDAVTATGSAANSSYLEDYVLNRDYNASNMSTEQKKDYDSKTNFIDTQRVYKDEHGYVVYTQPITEAQKFEYGYLLGRSTGTTRYISENSYVVSYQVIIDGVQTSIEGAIVDVTGKTDANDMPDFGDGTYVKGTETSQAYQIQWTLYAYKKIGNYYSLIPLDAGIANDPLNDATNANGKNADKNLVDNREDSKTTLNAGSPEGVSATYLLDNNTWFYIATYDKDGNAAGYIIKQGLKFGYDLKGATGADKAFSDNNLRIEYVANTDDNTIEVVFVRNADTPTEDAQSTPVYDITDKLFYLLDDHSTSTVTTYDTHKVIMGGGATVLNTLPDIIDTWETGSTPTNAKNNFYTVNGWTTAAQLSGQAANGVTKLTLGTDTKTYSDLQYKAPGVLKGTGGYVVMADNCVVYRINVSEGSVSALSASQIATGMATGRNAVVAQEDAYGYATVIYVAW